MTGLCRTIALLAATLAAGCYAHTQRFPGPMDASVDRLPSGNAALFPEGPEEVLVVRHADPVQIRPAGQIASFPMPFYDKQARVSSGSWVVCGAGGRLEVLWPSGTSIVLFGNCTGVIGSASRSEATFYFREVERASLMLNEGDNIELLGGAVLLAETGPFVVEHPRAEILRVRNRSKGLGRVAFRTGVFDIGPGQVIDLPLLEAGAAPMQDDPGFQTIDVGLPVAVRGAVQVERVQGGIRARATGENELRAGGVRVRMDSGEQALFDDLGFEGPAFPPVPKPNPGGTSSGGH